MRLTKIDNIMLHEVCKIGQGADCCRYLLHDPDNGFECGNQPSRLRDTIDDRAIAGSMTAVSINCAGI